MKQGQENFEMVKDEKNEKQNYIFQKDKTTKIGFYIVIAFLAICVSAVVLSGIFI